MAAVVIVSVKLMPDSPDSNLDELIKMASEKIVAFGCTVGKTDTEPVAFGLKAINVMFSMPEEKGSTEELEKQLESITGLSSVQVTDVRRAVG